jgi:hypothetical protein
MFSFKCQNEKSVLEEVSFFTHRKKKKRKKRAKYKVGVRQRIFKDNPGSRVIFKEKGA